MDIISACTVMSVLEYVKEISIPVSSIKWKADVNLNIKL